MAPTGNLVLFPSTATSVPRKSSLKDPTSRMNYGNPTDLKGVAIQVSAAPNTAPSGIIQPANTHIKHPLLPLVPKIETFAGAGRTNAPQPSLEQSNQSQTVVTIKPSTTSPSVEGSQDTLAPLPESRSFGSTKAIGRQPSVKISRPKVPANIAVVRPPLLSNPSTPQDNDRLSPLPNVAKFKTSPSKYAKKYSSPMSERSGSPMLVRTNSGASSQQPSSPPPMRSMFPQYDPSRPLSEQQYYPTLSQSASPSIPSEKVSKIGSPVEAKFEPNQFARTETFVDGYEHIPRATEKDMMQLWKASCCHFPVSARKLLLNISQPKQRSTCLAIGTSQDESLYTMAKDTNDRLCIKKHCPDQPSFTPVAQLVLPDPDRPRKDKDTVTIFPQMAGVHAQGKSSNPLSADSASYDASTNVISDAFAKYSCQLIRNTRKRDSLGAVTAEYTLKHPSLGMFPITITKSTTGGRHAKDPRAKISLHHCSAPAAAIRAETLVLAFLDFARDACVLDTPALLALDGPYVIDTVLTALLAVAVIENDVLMAETMTFAPPPTMAQVEQNQKQQQKSSMSFAAPPKSDLGKKKGGVFRKKQKVAKQEDDLPMVTQGALAVLGLSLKTAVWVLETGVKVTAGVVIGVSHLATKA